MGMCSNIKKSPKAELENSIKPEKSSDENKSETPISHPEEEYKDMEEWEGKFTNFIYSN